MTEIRIIKEEEKEKKPVPKDKGRKDVPEAKKKLIQTLVDLIDKNNIIGMINMENLPAKQLGSMRSQLRGKVVLFMTKKRFIKLAIEKSKKQNIKELEKYIKGMPALLFTDQNPFALFKLIKKNKSNAPIKPGQKAPNNILVQAGPTSFSPGPIIGELGSFRIKAGIEAGKVVIKEDAVVAKEGDVVNDKLAGLLARLGIEPMEIGLDLVAVYEKGNILTKEVLDVDEEAFMNSIKSAASEAFNLAVFIALPIKDTVRPLLSKAHREALALVKKADIMTSDNVGEVLAKAQAQASALKSKVTDTPVEKEEVKEEPKKEEEKKEQVEEKKEEETTKEKKIDVKKEDEKKNEKNKEVKK
ncbi:50S ribosomal protein L10 [Candidatus Woesearchaeota archaeon]|nr:50S ribosomal protein L10 [Candidatus Woesearchaeota archaeon]